MKLKRNILKTLILASAGALSFPAVGLAQNNPNYTKGDLVLYFQQEGGANTIYANLGNAALLFRGSASGPGATNLVNFLDINAELVAAFGENWASDPTVYAGAAAVFSTSSLSNTVTDGDPPRTVYVSRQRGAVGTVGQASSTAWSVANAGTGMSTASNKIDAQNNVLENSYTTAVAVSPTTVSAIDDADKNPFLAPGIQGNGFETFAGGVQQAGSAGTFGTFGAAGTVEFAIDLYRILAKIGLSGQVDGPQYSGSYEGTITINTAGQVSFISQGSAPSSNYDTWMATFPSITEPADKLAGADPDNDGFSNLEEFVLNGNPSVANQSIAPTLNAAGADFLFSFTRRDDSVTEAPAMFQYGSDLSGWTDVPVATDVTVDGVNVAVTPGDAVTDGVVVTLPKSKAVGGKLFGRLKIVK